MEGAASSSLQIVVAGAGPVGLLSAIAALQAGAWVTVVEQRTAYRRNVWFDLTGEGLDSPSQAILESWGLFDQRVRVQRHNNTDIVSVRCGRQENAGKKKQMAHVALTRQP